jgi:hypothetical protein
MEDLQEMVYRRDNLLLTHFDAHCARMVSGMTPSGEVSLG